MSISRRAVVHRIRARPASLRSHPHSPPEALGSLSTVGLPIEYLGSAGQGSDTSYERSFKVNTTVSSLPGVSVVVHAARNSGGKLSCAALGDADRAAAADGAEVEPVDTVPQAIAEMMAAPIARRPTMLSTTFLGVSRHCRAVLSSRRLQPQMAVTPPILLFVVGPGAVGKMTVGTEVAARTGLKLFHNHHTIDLLLRFFRWGSPPYGRLLSEFRRRIIEEVAASELPGLIFTYVWAFDHPGDDAEVEAYASIFRSHGGRVFYVELQAPVEVRLGRNETEFRLAEKPSKRDLIESKRQLLSLDTTYQLDSGDRFVGRTDYLKVDNTHVSAGDVAELAINRFGIPRLPQ